MYMNPDYSPMYLAISRKIIMKVDNSTLGTKLTDSNSYNFLENYIKLSVPLKKIDQLQKEINTFAIAINEEAWNSAPVIERKLKGLNIPKELLI